MFTVKEYHFEIDPQWAYLSASLGPNDRTGELRTSWDLSVRAIPRTIYVPLLGDTSAVRLTPGIEIQPQFSVGDWRALTGTQYTFKDDLDGAWLLRAEWEPLAHLKIVFGAIRGHTIDFKLDGIGLQESCPEPFGVEIAFSIATPLVFT